MTEIIPDWLVERELFIDSWAKEYVIAEEYSEEVIGVHVEQLATDEIQVIRVSDAVELPAVERFADFSVFYDWFTGEAIPELERVVK